MPKILNQNVLLQQEQRRAGEEKDAQREEEREKNGRLKRSENWFLLLYPDNPKHVEILMRVIGRYEYAYILHDKDKFEEETDEENPEKKAHWHVYVHTGIQKSVMQVCKELLIDGENERFIQRAVNKDACIVYMTHYFEHNKHQYDKTEIQTNIRSVVIEAFAKVMTDTDKMIKVCHIVQNGNFVQYSELVELLCVEGLVKEVRKCGNTIYSMYKDKQAYDAWLREHTKVDKETGEVYETR